MQKKIIFGILIISGITIALMITFIDKSAMPSNTQTTIQSPIPTLQTNILPPAPPITTTTESDIPELPQWLNWSEIPVEGSGIAQESLRYESGKKFGSIPVKGRVWRSEKIYSCGDRSEINTPDFAYYYSNEFSNRGLQYSIRRDNYFLYAVVADGPTGGIEGVLKVSESGVQVVTWSHGIPLEQFPDLGTGNEPWGPCSSADQYKVEYQVLVSEITPWSEILRFINM